MRRVHRAVKNLRKLTASEQFYGGIVMGRYIAAGSIVTNCYIEDGPEAVDPSLPVIAHNIRFRPHGPFVHRICNN